MVFKLIWVTVFHLWMKRKFFWIFSLFQNWYFLMTFFWKKMMSRRTVSFFLTHLRDCYQQKSDRYAKWRLTKWLFDWFDPIWDWYQLVESDGSAKNGEEEGGEDVDGLEQGQGCLQIRDAENGKKPRIEVLLLWKSC